MRKKNIYKVAITICLLLFATFLFLFMIRPENSLTIPKAEKYTSLDDFNKNKLQEALMGIKDSKKNEFHIDF